MVRMRGIAWHKIPEWHLVVIVNGRHVFDQVAYSPVLLAVASKVVNASSPVSQTLSDQNRNARVDGWRWGGIAP